MVKRKGRVVDVRGGICEIFGWWWVVFGWKLKVHRSRNQDFEPLRTDTWV